MSEEAIGEFVGPAGEQSFFYGCKGLRYTRNYKTDPVWGKHRESIRLNTKYTTVYLDDWLTVHHSITFLSPT
jgi:hypothetical protein